MGSGVKCNLGLPKTNFIYFFDKVIDFSRQQKMLLILPINAKQFIYRHMEIIS